MHPTRRRRTSDSQARGRGVDATLPPGPEVVEELPEDSPRPGRSFDEEVEAEVAELLGEIDPPAGPSEDPATDDDQH